MYKNYKSSVGNNLKHIQLTTKYRYKMMRKEKISVLCKTAIEEACLRHRIDIVILNIQIDHVHMIVDAPRTMCDSKLIQIIKGLSSYILFRICESLSKRYPRRHFWSAGYFCCSVGQDFDRVFEYVKNQDLHH